MFDLTPISTTNLFSTAQIVIVLAGFYFSWKSLETTRKSVELASENFALGTRNAQAQLFNQMVVQGRDLQYKHMELFYGGLSTLETAQKRSHHTGIVLGYFASCFELKKVLALPEIVERLLKEELRELMREKQVREKWEEVKHFHSKEFVEYVEGARGI